MNSPPPKLKSTPFNARPNSPPHAGGIEDVGTTFNPLCSPLLTDLYQLTMCYAYWKANRHLQPSTFELFFRKNPFKGEFTIFAGLTEVIAFIRNWSLTRKDIDFLESTQALGAHVDSNFFKWLSKLNTDDVKIYAVKEGTVIFPKEPLIRIEGPLAICQLLETTIVNLTNYASLITTNAARMRNAAGEKKVLLEFGLRRAQGPDGAISASRYSFMGGFDGTSNVLASQMFGIPCRGTNAHSYICSFTSLKDVTSSILIKNNNNNDDNNNKNDDDDRDINNQQFIDSILKRRKEMNWENTNEGELAAFISYARGFPNGFLCLVDTYDTLSCGMKNFLLVAHALYDLGYTPKGIRLDSGDLAYLSIECRKMIKTYGEKYNIPSFEKLMIVASNDINEDVLTAIEEQGHEINAYGIGTNLVTCQKQPSLGMVYKLVEINNEPRIKLSNETVKMTIPGKKQIYRLYSKNGYPLVDLMTMINEDPPVAGKKIICCHPFFEKKRVYVTPSKVESLLENCTITSAAKSLLELKQHVKKSLSSIRPDHLRTLNPTPYKVSVSMNLYTYIHELLNKELPIPELS